MLPGRVVIKVGKTLRWLSLKRREITSQFYDIGTRAMQEGKNIMTEEIPEGGSGELKRSVQATVSRRPNGMTVRIFPTAEHAVHVDGEGRTSPHVIVPRTKKALTFYKEGSYHFARKVKHPGSKRTPFSRRTAERLRKYIDRLLDEMVRHV